MHIDIPEVNESLERLMAVKSTFDGTTQPIRQWVTEHREKIKKNRSLIERDSATNDISILNMFLRDLLVRAIKGEMGSRVYEQLISTIKTKEDLTEANYRQVLKNAKYRWGEDDGSKVISEVVHRVQSVLKWDWRMYIQRAEDEREKNFPSDPILEITNISFKLRDLALSNFSPYYAAFDLHVTRVLTRLGWLNYGFPFLGNSDVEMGNNPGNDKNYLFLHRLFILLSDMTKGEYSPVDLDRILWHLGKSICGAKSKCSGCPINAECPTGLHRTTKAICVS
jgi:endonuclease III